MYNEEKDQTEESCNLATEQSNEPNSYVITDDLEAQQVPLITIAKSQQIRAQTFRTNKMSDFGAAADDGKVTDILLEMPSIAEKFQEDGLASVATNEPK